MSIAKAAIVVVILLAFPALNADLVFAHDEEFGEKGIIGQSPGLRSMGISFSEFSDSFRHHLKNALEDIMPAHHDIIEVLSIDLQQ